MQPWSGISPQAGGLDHKKAPRPHRTDRDENGGANVRAAPDPKQKAALHALPTAGGGLARAGLLPAGRQASPAASGRVHAWRGMHARAGCVPACMR